MLPDTPAKENAPWLSVTELREASPERTTCTPEMPAPSSLTTPLKVSEAGESGPEGDPPPQRARLPRAAENVRRTTRRLAPEVMVVPPGSRQSPFQ